MTQRNTPEQEEQDRLDLTDAAPTQSGAVLLDQARQIVEEGKKPISRSEIEAVLDNIDSVIRELFNRTDHLGNHIANIASILIGHGLVEQPSENDENTPQNGL